MSLPTAVPEFLKTERAGKVGATLLDIASLRDEVAKEQNEIGRIREELMGVGSRYLSALLKEVEGLRAERQSLESYIAGIQKQLEELRAQKSGFVPPNLKPLQDEITMLENRRMALINEIDKLRSEIFDLRIRLSQQAAPTIPIETRTDSLPVQIPFADPVEAPQIIERNDRIISELQLQLRDLQAALLQSRTSTDAAIYQQQIMALQSEIALLQQQNQQLLLQMRQLERMTVPTAPAPTVPVPVPTVPTPAPTVPTAPAPTVPPELIQALTSNRSLEQQLMLMMQMLFSQLIQQRDVTTAKELQSQIADLRRELERVRAERERLEEELRRREEEARAPPALKPPIIEFLARRPILGMLLSRFLGQ